MKTQNTHFLSSSQLSTRLHLSCWLCDKVCHWLATGRWFSTGTLISSTNKTDRHDITDTLLKTAWNKINITPICIVYSKYFTRLFALLRHFKENLIFLFLDVQWYFQLWIHTLFIHCLKYKCFLYLAISVLEKFPYLYVKKEPQHNTRKHHKRKQSKKQTNKQTKTAHVRMGFAPGFVSYKKGCTRLAAASD